jgi:hypothetical protein
MIVRSCLCALALMLAACGQSAPNPYPAEAKTRFDQSCPPQSAVCTCTWEGITRAMPYEEYEAALQRFRETGNMDPRVTRARTRCLERHDS